MGTTPRRVLHLVPSLVIGGVERLVLHLAQGMLDGGVDVRIGCVSRGGPLLDSAAPELRSRIDVLGKRFRYDASVLPRIAGLVRRFRPEIVHCHLFTAQSWGTFAARTVRSTVVVCTEHAAYHDPRWYMPWFYRRLGRMVDWTVAVSAEARDVSLARGFADPARVSVIENGVPVRGRPQAPLDGDPVRLGVTGRLVPEKGIAILIEALGVLRRRGRVLPLSIFGDGPLRAELERKAADEGVAEQVLFAGAVQDVPARLTALDLYVQPSLTEGFGLAVIEAAAAGLPVVATERVPAVQPISVGDGGWVVPAGDPDALAVQIESYLGLDLESRRRFGMAARRAAIAHYSIERTVGEYLALYERLLAGVA